jgi:hypothetical protein
MAPAGTIRVNGHTLLEWVVDALKWVDFALPQGLAAGRFHGQSVSRNLLGFHDEILRFCVAAGVVWRP